MPDVTVSGHRFHLTGRLIIGTVLAVLALVLIFQNTGNVRVSVLFWDVDKPLWSWLLLIFGGGFVVGSLFQWSWLQNRRHPKESTPMVPAPQ